MAGRAEVPVRIVAKLRSICGGLAEAYEEAAWVGTRWMIRKRNFAHLVMIEGGWPPAYARAAGSEGPLVVLTFRVSSELSDVLRTAGPPFFAAAWGTQWGTKLIGMALGPAGTKVDWKEVEVLIRESYRLLAPQRLVAGPALQAKASSRAKAAPRAKKVVGTKPASRGTKPASRAKKVVGAKPASRRTKPASRGTKSAARGAKRRGG